MTLSELFFLWPDVQRHFSADMTVIGISGDTRQIRPGYVFVAIRGNQSDGHQYIPQAIEKGCLALVVQDTSNVPSTFQGFVLKLEDTRDGLDVLASHFYGSPGHGLFAIAVTGTNGKTSTTHMIEKIFNDHAKPCGVIGTIDHHLGSMIFETQLTTPGPVELQERLKTFSKHGAKAVAMEVSSHALDQKRVESLPFNTAVFTNLTQDHLDYHVTMEKYFTAKERLFRENLARSTKKTVFAVVNTDDAWGRRIRLPDRAGLITYGMRDADITARVKHTSFAGTEVDISMLGQTFTQKFPFAGVFNVYNALGAIGAAMTAMFPPASILKSLQDFESVPGRLERVNVPADKYYFVDYAHSPDALENVLRTLLKIREESRLKNKIHVVFGCGGDRDRGKRPLMMAIAKKLGDYVYVTSDNPRTEDPHAIIADILSVDKSDVRRAGTWLTETVFVDADRASAIRVAAEKSADGDVIVVAGKGHENYQIIGTEKIYFSDKETILSLYGSPVRS